MNTHKDQMKQKRELDGQKFLERKGQHPTLFTKTRAPQRDRKYYPNGWTKGVFKMLDGTRYRYEGTTLRRVV